MLRREVLAGGRGKRLAVVMAAYYHAAMGKAAQIVTASRLTRKYQATIPAAVRRVLRLKQGDTVQFEIEGDRVTVRRQTVTDRAYLRGLQATLSEWDSPYDDEAYRDL